jgi:hypothetical protein
MGNMLIAVMSKQELRALRREGVDPTQTPESRKIAVAGTKRQSVLDRQSRQVRVGDQLRSSTEIAKQACEDGPVRKDQEQAPRRSRSQATRPRDATLN